MKRAMQAARRETVLFLLLFVFRSLALLAQSQIAVHGRVLDPRKATPCREPRSKLSFTPRPATGKSWARPSPEPRAVACLGLLPRRSSKSKSRRRDFVPSPSRLRSAGLRPAPIEIRMNEVARQTESVTVTADVNDGDVLSPDPALKVFSSGGSAGRKPGTTGRAHFDSALSD